MTDWRNLAACRGLDPNIFFPPEGGNPHPFERAKAICRACPVQSDCLDEAMVNKDVGIWGGTTENEREALRRRRGRERGKQRRAWAEAQQRAREAKAAQ